MGFVNHTYSQEIFPGNVTLTLSEFHAGVIFASQ